MRCRHRKERVRMPARCLLQVKVKAVSEGMSVYRVAKAG